MMESIKNNQHKGGLTVVVENYLVQRTFENRGYDRAFLESFDDPRQGQLAHLDDMLEQLKEIHDLGETIVVTPDYDMDGIMAGTCAFAGLAEMGFHVCLYMLSPQKGYGLHRSDVKAIRAQYPRAKAILTCDTGVTCFEGVSAARALGFKVLITDHHNQTDKLPKANCIVDPMLRDDNYPHPEICGAYVVYKVLQAYADRFCSRYTQSQIRRLRVFAGIGTVSDSMPMLYENRQLVRDAGMIARMLFGNGSEFIIKHIPGSPAYRGAFRGLYEVCLCLRNMGRLKPDAINEELFGFYMAPMFNSLKRMEDDMRHAFGVFFGADASGEVNYLYDLNDKRKQAVAEAMNELQLRPQPYAPYVWLSNAAGGILGLLAQRLMDKKGCPVCVVAQDNTGSYHGSGRSLNWYPFLTRTKGQDIFAAGHEAAFGVGFDDEASIQRFCDFMRADVEDVMRNMPSDAEVRPDFIIDTNGTGDAVIDIMAFIEYMAEMERFKPFGPGFPEPNVMLRFRPEEAEWSVMGSVKQHLKLTLDKGFEVLLWNQAAKIRNQKRKGEDIIVMGKLGMSVFKDIETVIFTGDMVEPGQP